MEKITTLLVADQHYLIRQGLKVIFNQFPSKYHIIKDTDQYETVIPLVSLYNPDVVIIGLNIHGISATTIIEQLITEHPQQKILVIDTNEDTKEVIKILQMGVHGYILKQCDQEEIIEAIEAMMAGKKFFCSNVLKLNNPSDCSGFISLNEVPIKLSEREIEILELIAQGLTNKEIADKKFISSHTVASHRKNLMKKFKAKNNVDLVISAIRDNFIAP